MELDVIDLTEIEKFMQQSQHIPVMAKEVEEYLNLPENGSFADCTLGLGGHSLRMLSRLGPLGKIVGIDCDLQAMQQAKENLSAYAQQCIFVHDNFRNLDSILEKLGIRQVDGILLDLGLSSFQLDNPQRGFSIKSDGPLDMRMDQDFASEYLSAKDLINSSSEEEIATILKEYGEERFYKRIARAIVAQRPLQTTRELVEVVLRALPYRMGRAKIHPATRTFQALRIAVNKELESLAIVLSKGIDHLKSGGRMGVISFHSLEDRIVKHKFQALAREGKVKLMTKKPMRPTEEEAAQNPRARSARFRVAEKI